MRSDLRFAFGVVLVCAFSVVLFGCASPVASASSNGSASTGTGASKAATSTATATHASGPDCSEMQWTAGDITQSWQVGALERSMLIHVPESYDPQVPTELVLNYHGVTMNAAKEAWLTGMNDFADARNFIVVYPQGIFDSWNGGDCCGDGWSVDVDDVAFTRDIVRSMQSSFCIDPKRIFAAGFSNGGFLTFRLACEMSDTFAAIGNVSAAMGVDPGLCRPSRPVPLFAIHGNGDYIVPYDGGTPLIDPFTLGPLHFRSFPDTIDIWRTIDGCTTPAASVWTNGDASCERSTCAAGSAIMSCTIQGGGHQWPGGPSLTPLLGLVSQDIGATASILNFFDAHPMP